MDSGFSYRLTVHGYVSGLTSGFCAGFGVCGVYTYALVLGWNQSVSALVFATLLILAAVLIVKTKVTYRNAATDIIMRWWENVTMGVALSALFISTSRTSGVGTILFLMVISVVGSSWWTCTGGNFPRLPERK